MSRLFEHIRNSEAHEPARSAAENAGAWAPDSAATVMCRTNARSRMLTQGKGAVPVVETFRLLDHRLCRLRLERTLKKVLVTSAVPKEGKTVIAANLAATLSQSGTRTLLLDADLRNPGVPRALGVEALPGLADVLEGRQELEEVIRRVMPACFYYLPSGRPVTNPADLLQSPRLRSSLDWLAETFDWVVVDSPPLSTFADAHWLAAACDGLLMVVRSGFTRQHELEEALASVGQTFVAGIVLNASDERMRDSYYSYYHSAGRNGDQG